MWLNWLTIGAVAFALGYLGGCQHEKSAYDAYRASVVAAGEAQNKQTEQTIAHHKQIAQSVKEDYETRIAAIRAAYRVRPSNSGLMPPASCPAGDSNAATSYDILALQCAETTQQLISLQEFIKETQ